jgi:hypothetical protein
MSDRAMRTEELTAKHAKHTNGFYRNERKVGAEVTRPKTNLCQSVKFVSDFVISLAREVCL